MANDSLELDLESLTEKLQQTFIPTSSGVSFAGKTLKLDTKEDARDVVESIDGCKSLEYVNFEGNSMGVEAAEEVGKALSRHPELKNAIWKDMFTGRLKDEIPLALKSLGKGVMDCGAELEVLDLSDNASGPIGVDGFGPLLRSSSCFTLKELRLNNMGLGITGAKMLAEALADCLRKSRSEGKPLALKVFIAGRNRLENEGATALARVFKEMGSLEEVSIPQNGIRWEGVKAMAEGLSSCRSLKKLSLNDNTVGEEGSLALASSLRSLPLLASLDLGDCLVKSSGARKLVQALASNPLHQLQEVNLSANEIRVDVGAELASVLGKMPSMKSLNLNGNQFGDKGKEDVLSILDSLGKKQILESLSEDEGETDDEEDEVGEEGREGEDEEELEEGEEEEELEEEEEEDDEDDEEEDEEVGESDENEEVGFGISSGISPMNRPSPTQLDRKVTCSEFLSDPKLSKFMALEGQKGEAILAEVKGDPESLMEAIGKVSSLIGTGRGDAGAEALRVSESLFKELFSRKELSPGINNSLPVHLGLIKGEDKEKAKKLNREGCVAAVKNAISIGIIQGFTRTILESLTESHLCSLDNNARYST